MRGRRPAFVAFISAAWLCLLALSETSAQQKDTTKCETLQYDVTASDRALSDDEVASCFERGRQIVYLRDRVSEMKHSVNSSYFFFRSMHRITQLAIITLGAVASALIAFGRNYAKWAIIPAAGVTIVSSVALTFDYNSAVVETRRQRETLSVFQDEVDDALLNAIAQPLEKDNRLSVREDIIHDWSQRIADMELSQGSSAAAPKVAPSSTNGSRVGSRRGPGFE